MKPLPLVITFIIIVIFTIFALSFFAPSSQSVEREITIHKPIDSVYLYLKELKHFNQWSVWGSADSTIQYTYSDKAGVVGAVANWQGADSISGKGKITIEALEANEKIITSIELIAPSVLKTTSTFYLRKIAGNITQVKWLFEIPSKKPWNIFNFFASLDDEKGSDFEKGLQRLKVEMEKD